MLFFREQISEQFTKQLFENVEQAVWQVILSTRRSTPEYPTIAVHTQMTRIAIATTTTTATTSLEGTVNNNVFIIFNVYHFC